MLLRRQFMPRVTLSVARLDFGVTLGEDEVRSKRSWCILSQAYLVLGKKGYSS